jgi:hypothetical protein
VLGDQVGEQVAGGVDDEEAVGLVVDGLEALDRHVVHAADEERVLGPRAAQRLAVQHDPARLPRVADDPEPLAPAVLDLDALLVGAVRDLDRVAAARRVHGLLDRLEAALALADLERRPLAALTRRQLSRVRSRRVLVAGAGVRHRGEQCGRHHGGQDASHRESLSLIR